VAIKNFRISGEGIPFTACREILLLQELSHENIVNLRDVFIDFVKKSIYLIFECAAFDLFEVMKVFPQMHREPCIVKSFIQQILRGIYYLHSNWIIHRDIKPANILVMKQGIIKIADFGLARIFRNPLLPLYQNGTVVTIWYRAPELLLGSNHYTTAIDMWAIGCIFAELILGVPLFQGKEKHSKEHNGYEDDQVNQILKVLGNPLIEDWPDIQILPHYQQISKKNDFKSNLLSKFPTRKLCSEGYDLLSKLLTYNPETRATSQEALEHRYFTEPPEPSTKTFENFV